VPNSRHGQDNRLNPNKSFFRDYVGATKKDSRVSDCITLPLRIIQLKSVLRRDEGWGMNDSLIQRSEALPTAEATTAAPPRKL
jgi:hypothetical protein